MPALLMLDEPFTALDTRSLYSIKEYIRRCVIETQIPCILVTHRIADAADLGNHICLLDKGRIACQGDAERVREAYECECPDRSPGGRCGCG
jgi:ABC-type sulfate/molybdate transport systems ATPase subunit